MKGDAGEFEALLGGIRACRICEAHLPLGPRPVLQVSPTARLLIAGQAPGRRVHETGIPFNDPSGDRLRAWLGVDRATFYDATRVALVPMGFCYPGTGKSGDLPPRPECAEAWRAGLLERMPGVRLVLAFGQYSIAWHLGSRARGSLAETVYRWREHVDRAWPMPHPSPRNNRWLRNHPWFEAEVIPELRLRVAAVLAGDSAGLS